MRVFNADETQRILFTTRQEAQFLLQCVEKFGVPINASIYNDIVAVLKEAAR